VITSLLPISVVLLAASIALWKVALEHSRLRAAWGFLGLFAVWAAVSGFPEAWLPSHLVVYRVGVALIELAGVQVGVVLIFDLLLRRLHLPKFASEIVIVGGYLASLFSLLYNLGVNVTGIFATSAVATAVVGLALQDMLSNIAGGIALELEGGVRVGDYIRCAEHSGWVQHIRLRHTAIRTADGDTVFLPNSFLTRSPVQILSSPRRYFIPISMPYTVNPQDVIDAVEFSLRTSPSPDMALDPPPRCVLQELNPNYLKMAAVVWLKRPGHETLALSGVNVRLYFALRRAGVPATEITHLLEMKAGGGTTTGNLNPVEVLRRTPILRLLSDPDLYEIGAHLHHLSFAPGEHIIRQGDGGDSMYFIVAGSVAISYRSSDGAERQVSQMDAGDFFGEASLLTGEQRSASAVALTQVDCYRLDKGGLQGVLNRHPELAEDMSVVMAHRQMELSVARERLDQETARRREAENQTQLLARIRKFFDINGASE
jgi:small-conductance mechanosensitive channel/CRP-like cAMP-binding protein